MKSTVSDIKKNKAKILTFKREMADMGMSLKAKTMRLGDNYHYNNIIILGENVNFAMLQLSELFAYPNTPLPKGRRISEDALYCTVLCVCMCVCVYLVGAGLASGCSS